MIKCLFFYSVAAKKGMDNQAALSETPKTSAKTDESSAKEAEKASIQNTSLDTAQAQLSAEKDDVLKVERVENENVEKETVTEEETKNEEVEEKNDEKSGSVEKMDISAPESGNDDKGIENIEFFLLNGLRSFVVL